ncbi:halocyanin [Halobacteriales archaeon QS_4_62_28]|nr:MAG: halocyanin [Halobacteriales archaeon QS_4_62_28]
MDRRAYLRGIAGVSVLAASGCLGVGADESTEYDIGMSTQAFRPEQYEVGVGDTVVWRNTSSHAHSVTAYESGLPESASFFASGGFEDEQSARDAWASQTDGALHQGDSYSHTFEVAGEYQYFCIPHERSQMVGTIVVG